MAQNQSADQLQSLVEDVASQSLGGSEHATRNPISAHLSTHSLDPGSSKRKPVSFDTSDEFDENTPPGKPTIKRLKSEGYLEELPDTIIEEYKLLACVPQVKRLGSGRQVDNPVNKATFWERDYKTWHLNYPEMTQLQYEALSDAARDRGEEFTPHKSPLWDLAMKYFPPISILHRQNGRLTSLGGLRRDDRKLSSDVEFPPTAAPGDSDSIPDTLPPESQIVVPVQAPADERAMGVIESDPNSCIKGISIPITDSLTSFGRHSDNTVVFEASLESKVPKYAFKIVLWKEGFDPAKATNKATRPWLQEASGVDKDSYFFWVSSKATMGISINGFHLPSVDPKNPSGPSHRWTRIYHGDTLQLWGTPDASLRTMVTFKCFWGGSEQPRGDDKRIELAPPSIASKLDNACYRTERRVREDRALAEWQLRITMVEKERERSREFEEKRLKAVEFMRGKQTLPVRRESYS